MRLFQDFADFIILLQKHKVDYLVVGGYAVGIHSQAKMTQDIDFWIRPTVGNAENLIKVFEEFGIPDINISVNDLTKSGSVIQFGNPPLRVDILTSIDGVEFEEAFRKKFTTNIENIKNINFISLNDLIRNKETSKRQKDSYDLQWLKDYGKDNKKI